MMRIFFQKFFFYLVLFVPQFSQGQSSLLPYSDLTHTSKVFGHDKFYRLYLPEGYESHQKRYPVIYFFHGWGGRHFKDDNARLEYDKLKELVDKYQVILVMWDGSMEEEEPRPYNIGNHKDIKYEVQMKDYFCELVAHIDSSYLTLADRGYRGIIGFSMGGILSFYLAGKYPDKVSAAVNLVGTPEFFIGYPSNHTLYQLRYTFTNLRDVKTRQHSGETDILVYLNDEVRKGAEWQGYDYEFMKFKGGHMVDLPGETKNFELAMNFVVSHFVEKDYKPAGWSHYDLYADFEIWNYHVSSNKNCPGFVFLRNVTKNGFGLYCYKWLPDGPALPQMKASVKTAPLYEILTDYSLLTYEIGSGIAPSIKKIKSNSDGTMNIENVGGSCEYGIFKEGDPPEIVVSKYKLKQGCYLNQGTNQITFELLNRGGEMAGKTPLTVTIGSNDTSIIIRNNKITLIPEGQSRLITLPETLMELNKLPPSHGEPFQIRLLFTITWNNKEWKDEIIVPVLFKEPEFTGISIDDGKIVCEKAFGAGNANGSAEAGERIMLYTGDHRLRLYTNDPYIIRNEEELADEQLPSVWEDSFTLSSIISIAKNCPPNHVIEFTASYETNTYNPIERKVHWGGVKITVK